MRTAKAPLVMALAAVSAVAPILVAGCVNSDPAPQGGDREGGDPDDVGEVSSRLFAGDSPDSEVIARAKYWYDEGQAGRMGPYTNDGCPIDGNGSSNPDPGNCHRDPEGNGVYPNTHFYRRDCSGMASMSLHMSFSATTAGFRDGRFDFYPLDNDANAKPGDLLLNTKESGDACSYGNHTIIFDHWIDSSSWKGYSGGSMPPRHNTYYVKRDASGKITNMDQNDSCHRVFHAWRSPHVIHDVSCTPKTCAQLGLSCGSVSSSENCGTALNCGGCASGQTCDDGTCVTTTTSSYAKSWWTGTLQNAGLCAGVSGTDQLATGAVIEMETCSHDGTGLDQNWYMTKYRNLKNYKSGKCLRPDSVSSGSLTRQQGCDSSDEDQIWRFRSMEIVNGQTGYCADVPAASYYAGQRVIQWPCHGGDNQLFTYLPQTGEIKVNGWCLDAGTGSNGAQVTLQQCDGTSSQQWNDGHGGFVSALATASPRCLALEGGATAGANAHLVMSNCSDTVEQMWGLRGQIEHFNDEYCLKNADTASHELKLRACDETIAGQKFTFWMNF